MGIDEAVKLKDLGVPVSLIGAVFIISWAMKPLFKMFADYIQNMQAERAANSKQSNENLMSLIKTVQDRAVEQRERIDDLERRNDECERRNAELEVEMKTLRALIYRTGNPP